ncbi:hypothetical protein [Thiohalorhabdus methylotrophus]|uniref:HNH endonuclease n=1 Tax=Thiohalorhabdus methylotrophus TaxID=3242694 RepID=A0ABV4TVK5_9GAMM
MIGADSEQGGTSWPCALCGRIGPRLTVHHLIPRAMHRRKWVRRRFGSEEPKRRLLYVCHPCHKHIHAVLTEQELARHYNTAEALLGHPDIRRFVAWIADKPADFRPRTRRMRRESG